MFGADPASPIDSIAHIIQVALTPVFLLSGIAALLNVFSTRLARIADRSHLLTAAMDSADADARRQLEAQFRFIHRRSRALDIAVLLATFGGGSTCAAALLLFVGSLRDSTIAGLLYICFGLALICTTGALSAFMLEVLMASRGLRDRQQAAVERGRARDGVGRDEDTDADGEAGEPAETHDAPGSADAAA